MKMIESWDNLKILSGMGPEPPLTVYSHVVHFQVAYTTL